MAALKIAIACGGTGGHIFPGLAVAQTLKSRGHNVSLWLAGKDGEQKAIEGWNGNIYSIPSEGFQHGISFRSINTLIKIIHATIKTYLLMKKNPPDILLAMGSYASIPPALACQLLKKPYILHEANVIPGRAVSFLASKAKCVALSFEEAEKYLNAKTFKHTGMPLRKTLFDKSLKSSKIQRNAEFTILITGGSRGANFINEKIIEALNNKKFKSLDFKIIHIVGKNNSEIYINFYKENNINAEVYNFVHNIEDYFLAADFIISRSGASTCFELCAFGKPSLLIPYPHAVRDHQMKNAMVLHKHEAADVIPQNNLTTKFLEDYLFNIITNPQNIKNKAINAKKLYPNDAAEMLSNLIEESCIL